jgi:hypothetical protein
MMNTAIVVPAAAAADSLAVYAVFSLIVDAFHQLFASIPAVADDQYAALPTPSCTPCPTLATLRFPAIHPYTFSSQHLTTRPFPVSFHGAFGCDPHVLAEFHQRAFCVRRHEWHPFSVHSNVCNKHARDEQTAACGQRLFAPCVNPPGYDAAG